MTNGSGEASSAGTDGSMDAEISPTVPATEEPGFFERLNGLTPEDWNSGVKAYLYRVWPIIDRRDNEHFLAKVSEPFDEDYILRHFGSGKYHLRLNDARGKTIATKLVSIHNPAFPPKVSPDEVVESDPRNETYFKVWAPRKQAAVAVTALPGEIAATGSVPADNSAAAVAIERMAEIANRAMASQAPPVSQGKESALDKSVVDLWSETAKQRDALAERVANIASSNQAIDPLALLDRVMSIVEKTNRAAVANVPVAPAEAANPKSTVEQMQDMVALVASLKDTFGSGEAGAIAPEDGSIWGSVLRAATPVLTQLAAPIGQALAMKMFGGTMASAPGAISGAGPNAGAPGNLSSVQTIPPVAPSTAFPGGATDPNAAGANPGNLEEAIAQQQLAQMAGQIAPMLLSALNQGRDGGSFAEGLTTLYGGLTYEQIAGLGKDGIMTALKSNPPLWAQLAPIQARVEQFVAEFIEWGQSAADAADADAEDDSAEDQPAARANPLTRLRRKEG